MIDNLENRQFLGLIIPGNEIDVKHQLVEVAGIFYRYQLHGYELIQADRRYKIVQTHGNQMVIKLVEK